MPGAAQALPLPGLEHDAVAESAAEPQEPARSRLEELSARLEGPRWTMNMGRLGEGGELVELTFAPGGRLQFDQGGGRVVAGPSHWELEQAGEDLFLQLGQQDGQALRARLVEDRGEHLEFELDVEFMLEQMAAQLGNLGIEGDLQGHLDDMAREIQGARLVLDRAE